MFIKIAQTIDFKICATKGDVNRNPSDGNKIYPICIIRSVNHVLHINRKERIV